MKYLAASLTVLVCLTYGTIVVAADWDNGGIKNARVLDVTTLQDGAFYVRFDKDICDGSTINNIGYVHIGMSLSGVNWTKEGAMMIHRTALAAKLSGNTATVYANDSGSRWGCRMGALKIEQ